MGCSNRDSSLPLVAQNDIKSKKETLAGVGIASFGPLDPDPDAPTFGHITTTPKPGWANTDIAGEIRHALDLAVGFDTDVNGAVLGEHRWGAAQGLDTFVYLTIGTGIGGGVMAGGKLVHGALHPEIGHLMIPHDLTRDPYEGHCPYHGDCFEGLACGPAIAERWAMDDPDLPRDHPAWVLEAHYIALARTNGKTTTTALVRHVLNRQGDAGSIGTLGAFDGEPARLERA